jgi:hypothetical protein
LSELGGGHGAAKKVALSFRAVPRLKKPELFLRFDALGDHPLLEILAISIMAPTIAESFGSSEIWRTKDWSIFKTSMGNCRR